MTEYRIITVERRGDPRRYLQFKTTTVRRRSSPWWRFWNVEYQDVEEVRWRFVPDDLYATTLGWFQTSSECPSVLPMYQEHRFLACFHGHEDFIQPLGLTWFAKKWPDINKYFEHLRERREKYLAEKQQEKSAPVRYL